MREKRFLVESFDEVPGSPETVAAWSGSNERVGSSTGKSSDKLSKMVGGDLGWLGRGGVAPRALKSESLGS